MHGRRARFFLTQMGWSGALRKETARLWGGALEIIRRDAVSLRRDQIAVLNRRATSTGKGMRWNQIRVATARRNIPWPVHKASLPDPGESSLSQDAAHVWRPVIRPPIDGWWRPSI